MRLIDADALKDWSEIIPLTDDGGIDINDFDEKLMSMPTVDAVPVIRCKDCRYNADCVCVWHSGNDYTWIVVDNDYCSCAERKEE